MTYILDDVKGGQVQPVSATTLTILQEDSRPGAEDTGEEEDNPELAALKTLTESVVKSQRYRRSAPEHHRRGSPWAQRPRRARAARGARGAQRPWHR